MGAKVAYIIWCDGCKALYVKGIKEEPRIFKLGREGSEYYCKDCIAQMKG